VFADDLVWTGRQLRVRWPVPDENDETVRAIMESQQAKSLGVELRVVATMATVPQDDRQAEELMINGL
jgi:hypothetical protein